MNKYYLIIQGMRKIKSNNYSAKKREGKIKINLRILTYNLALLPIAYWAYEQFNGKSFYWFHFQSEKNSCPFCSYVMLSTY